MTDKSQHVKWVHGSGEDEEGACLACHWEANDARPYEPTPAPRPHEPVPSAEADADEPYCAVCGHDLDLVMAHG